MLQHFRAQPTLASDAAYAGMDGVAQGEGAEAADLSPRECEVLQLLAQGYVNKEVAQRLFIAPATVGSHIKSLYRKLAVNSRVQMVRSAQDRGLL